MKFSLLILVLLVLCFPAIAQQHEVTWGCALRPATDTVTDTWTLDCKERVGDKTFSLVIPKAEWPSAWSLPGEREFYYGVVDADGIRQAIKTPATHCDTEFHRAFGGNRVQSQMCGVMFKKE